MSDILLLFTLGIMVISILVDFYRVWQFKQYLKQNKTILSEMEFKRKQIQELAIRMERISEINETIND